MSKLLASNDYCNGLGDKYGRRKCDNCQKRRRINAYWKDTNRVLCKDCSTSPGKTLSYSIRSGSIGMQL